MNEYPAVVGGSPEGWTPDTPEKWMDDAACAETNPEAFFPEIGESARPAKSVCAGCPVAAECLAYALDHGEQWGVWGGLSPKERKHLRRAA